MSKRVIILKGLPACGKTTWAKEQVDRYPGKYKRISKDDLRAMLDNKKWSKGNEKFILATRDSLILLALQEGYHVLVDDTNLHNKHEQAIRELVKGLAIVEIKDFTDVPLETCIERDQKRPDYVGEQVIRKMHRDFLQPPRPIVPAYNRNLPGAIISDIDGTLALISGRSPYDTARCEQDALNEPVADIVGNYHKSDFRILLASGRSEQHRSLTENWLQQKGVRYHELFMRADGDSRKDAIIKREIYENHIAGKYNIKFVLDDRQQVVDLWRSLGLTCLQVDDGDF
jgi:predicted kinase